MSPPLPSPRRSRHAAVALLASLAAGCSVSSPGSGATTPPGTAPASVAPSATTRATSTPQVAWQRGVAYGDDPAQVMDVAVPAAATPSPTGDRQRRPAMLLVHGGAWTGGSRGDHGATAEVMARLGWVAATIDYRLAPAHTHPAAERDVRAALAHLHDRADALGVDPGRVVLTGDSAGGHLASLVALQDGRAPVAAWISWSGVHALEQLPERLAGTRRAWLLEHLAAALGCDPAAPACASTARDASPVAHASADDPPGLLVHSSDELVPLDDARQLQQALQEAGAPVELVVREGHAHGAALIASTGDEAAAFLDEVLELQVGR